MKRRSSATALIIAVLGVALVAGDVTVAVVRSGPPSHPRHVVTAQPLSVNIPQRSYDVAPPLALIIGGVTARYPLCRLSDLRATAALHPDGTLVEGAAVVQGHRCSLSVSAAPTLVDRTGRQLPIPVVRPPVTDSPPGYDFAFGLSGEVTVGFTWRGSWCGARAASLQLRVNGGDLRIPLSGAQPTCAGSSNTELIPGIVGGSPNPNQAVQGPPPEWSKLKVSVTAQPFVRDTHLGVLRVVLLNPTSRPVVLTPDPTYLVGLWDTHGEGTAGIAERPLPAKLAGTVVPAHGYARISLPPIRFNDRGEYPRNGLLRIDFSVAGAPSATTYTILRCRRTTVRFGGAPRCSSPLRPSAN
ncbi:MAG TPA: hypothetical protein VHV76_15690 [Mycobacteriales bacterium]|nr:hypothetical protein [Mycobacteriales bacterium]